MDSCNKQIYGFVLYTHDVAKIDIDKITETDVKIVVAKIDKITVNEKHINPPKNANQFALMVEIINNDYPLNR